MFTRRNQAFKQHHSIACTVDKQKGIKISASCLFLLFPLSFWSIPQSGNLVYVVESFRTAPSPRHVPCDCPFLQRPQCSTITIWGIRGLFPRAASSDTSGVHIPCTGMRCESEGENVPTLEWEVVLHISPAWYLVGLSCCHSHPQLYAAQKRARSNTCFY